MINKGFTTTIFMDPNNLVKCKLDLQAILKKEGWIEDEEEYYCDSPAGHIRLITDKTSYSDKFTFVRVEVYDANNKSKPKTFIQLHVLNIASIHISGNHITIIFKNSFPPIPDLSFEDVVYSMWEVNSI